MNHDETSTTTRRQKILFGVGSLLGLGGLLLLFIGIGTTLEFVYAQSHPVSPATALSLRIEYTIIGLILLFVSGLAVQQSVSANVAE
jgi:hypothetical protein